MPETGTGLAIYTIPKSATVSDGKAPFSGWGGARNRADRTSERLTGAQAANIIAAADFAAARGVPLNRHVTIHWERAGVPDHSAAWATGRYLKLAGDWIGKRGGRFAWAWARENGDGKGNHVHILLHLPAGFSLGAMQRRWIARAAGVPYRVGVVRTSRVGGTAGAWASSPDAYRVNLDVVLAYVLKGASPEAARTLGLERVEACGRVIGKRAATSQNIGRGARARAGWQSLP